MRLGSSRATPVLLTLVPLLLLVAPAGASVEYRFEAITGNDPANVAAGERQLRMIVVESDVAAADVELYFSADGASGESTPPEPLSITKILFVDPLLLIDAGSILDIEPIMGDSVRFQRDPDPPGPANDFSFSSAGPKGAVYHGIQPREPPYGLLLPLFDLTIDGKAGLELFLAALDGSPDVGALTIELTVEGFADEGSEVFRPVPAPEPAGGGLAALGALALLRARRRGAAPPPEGDR